MAIQFQGNSGTVAEVSPTNRALRNENRPVDVEGLGAYSVCVFTGTMAAGLAANAPIFSVRWTDATRLMIVRRIALYARNAGTAFTAGTGLFDLLFARAFTVSDSGGTAVVLSGNNQKRKTVFGTSLVGDMRISSTAALTAGTRTLDANALFSVKGFLPATSTNYVFVGEGSVGIPGAATQAGATRPLDLWRQDFASEWPMVLATNEGFIIRATVPATGTWEAAVALDWVEVTTTSGF